MSGGYMASALRDPLIAKLKRYTGDGMAGVRDWLVARDQHWNLRGVLARDPSMPSSTAPSSGEYEQLCRLTRGATREHMTAAELFFGTAVRGPDGKVVTVVGQEKCDGGAYYDALRGRTPQKRRLAESEGWSVEKFQALLGEFSAIVRENARSALKGGTLDAVFDAERREAERERIRGWRVTR